MSLNVIYNPTNVKNDELPLGIIQVWTDGSCTGNGTPRAKCGIGVYYGTNDPRNRSVTLEHGRITNNRAELCAILYVLCTNAGHVDIQINTDSLYSINCIKTYRSKWEANNWVTSNGKAVESRNLIQYIYSIIDRRRELGGNTDVVHVKAHADNVGNNAADCLARKATSSILKDAVAVFLIKLCNVPL